MFLLKILMHFHILCGCTFKSGGLSRHVEWRSGEFMVNMGGVTNEIGRGGHDIQFFCSFLVGLLASSLHAILV